MPEQTSSPQIAYLSLGSNIGDREGNLRAALAALDEEGVRVKRVSSFYETEPVDYLAQPWFLNCVAEVETNLDPFELLQSLKALETEMGSKKDFAKGPRKMDLDILLYDDQTIDLPDLQIPHPRMLQRRFVLVPLVELAPSLKHPQWSAPAAQLLAQTSDKSQVRRI